MGGTLESPLGPLLLAGVGVGGASSRRRHCCKNSLSGSSPAFQKVCTSSCSWTWSHHLPLPPNGGAGFALVTPPQ